jgi:hypothetical protein
VRKSAIQRTLLAVAPDPTAFTIGRVEQSPLFEPKLTSLEATKLRLSDPERTLPSLDQRANPRVPAQRFALVDTSVRRW